MSKHTVAGELIRLARNRRQLSAAELAELCGLNEQTVLRIERGENEPKLPNLLALAKELDLDLNVLVQSYGERPWLISTSSITIVSTRPSGSLSIARGYAGRVSRQLRRGHAMSPQLNASSSTTDPT